MGTDTVIRVFRMNDSDLIRCAFTKANWIGSTTVAWSVNAHTTFSTALHEMRALAREFNCYTEENYPKWD